MATGPYERGEGWEDTDLELIDSDERLPWLEAGDEDERGTGFATSRLIMVGVFSLLFVAALVGAAWFTMGVTSDEPPADGSVVEAPAEPYKTRPENPGGKEFAGTGDTSFAVGEGKRRESKLADKPATPAPVEPAPAETAAPSLATTMNEGPRSPEPAKGTSVQVGAYPKRADAEEAWGRLIRQTEVLNGVRHRVAEAQVDIGTVYRLQALTGSNAEARSLCNRLQNDGLACFVK